MRTLALLALATTVSAAQTPTDSVKLSSVVSGLKLRSIGPALTSGRIADIAVHPTDKSIWYVGTAAGGVWKTTNNGISFTPDLRRRGVVLDRRRDDRPPEPERRLGRHRREQRAARRRVRRRRLQVDRRRQELDEHGAQGIRAHRPHRHRSAQLRRRVRRRAGSALAQGRRPRRLQDDRRRQDVDEDSRASTTGPAPTTFSSTRAIPTCSSPRRGSASDARSASSPAARGPASTARPTPERRGRNRSRDFPSEDLGRIGLSMSPANPSVVYAMAEAANDKGGFFRSRDGGASWERMGGTQMGGNYYNRIFADPKNVDRVYAADVNLQVTDDGGKTFHRVGEQCEARRQPRRRDRPGRHRPPDRRLRRRRVRDLRPRRDLALFGESSRHAVLSRSDGQLAALL